MEMDEKLEMPMRAGGRRSSMRWRWRKFGCGDNFRLCPWRRKRSKPGAPEALRSDDSIVPLSAGVVTSTSTSATATSSRILNNPNQKHKRRSSLLCGLGPSQDDEDSSDDGRVLDASGHVMVKSSGTTVEPALTPFADWMAELPLHLHELPFNQISIPGSHDSCTATLDRDGGLHPDAPELYRDVLRVFGSWAKTVAHRWSQTQDRTFIEQLHLGIRYFDLRISARPGFEELYLVHGFYGDTVRICLTSINAWLDLHPKEIVLLDMNHFHGLEDHHHQRLVSDLQNIFGDKMVPALDDARQLTLAQMWKNHQQVIVFYHHVKSGVSTPNTLQPAFNYLWPGSMIPSPWPRTTRIKDLIDFLDRSTIGIGPNLYGNGNNNHNQHPSSSSQLARPRNSFFVSQGVLTPTVYTVLSHVTSSLKDHFARPAAQAVVEWLKRHRRIKSLALTTTTRAAVGVDGDGVARNETDCSEGPWRAEGVNIVIVDFVDLDPSYVETVVKLNYADDEGEGEAGAEEAVEGAEKDAVHRTASEEFRHLAPVIQIIQQSTNQLRDEPLLNSQTDASLDNHSSSCHPPLHHHPHSQSQLIGCSTNNKSSLELAPNCLTEDAASSSSALSSRALTPTPLQFIDAGNNSPAATPVRTGFAAREYK